MKTKNTALKRYFFVPAFGLCVSRIGLTPHKHYQTIMNVR